MQSDRLFINDFEVDLFPGTVIAITYQINDLAELKDRQANYSNRFKVPKTKRNLLLLQNPDLVQSPTLIPYRKNSSVVIKDGVEVVSVGYSIIESTDEFINIIVYSGNADFFSIIEGRKLSHLDFSYLDMLWNQPNALSTFANTTGIKYSIINYGDLVNINRNVDVKNQRAAVFYHTLIDAIFAGTNFTKTGEVFSDPTYLKLLLPYTNKIEKHTQKWIDSRKFSIEGEPQTVSASSTPKAWRIGITNDSTSGFYDLAGLITTGIGTDPSVDPEAAYLTIDEPTEWRHRATITFTVNSWTDAVSGFGFFFGIATAWQYVHPDTADGGGTGTFTVEFDVNCFYDNLSLTKEFLYMLFNDTNVTLDSLLWNGIPTEKTVYGSTWNVSSNIPEEMSQKDLIKSLAQMYGLLFQVDSLTGTVDFFSFKRISNKIPFAKDWSHLLHWQNNNHKTETKIGNYGQKNILSYKVDSSDKDIKIGFGSGSFLIDDQTLESEVSLFELAFSATASDYFLENLKIPIIRKLDGLEFKTSTNPRVLIDDTQNITGNPIAYGDGVVSSNISGDVPLCYFVDDSKAISLGFDNSLLADNYTELIALLNKAKKISVLMKLNSLHVFNFDHTTPVYLSQHAAYFYVNKIINFTGAGLTSVELIRLETDYSALVSVDVDVVDPAENLELQEDGGYSLGEDYSKLGREGGN